MDRPSGSFMQLPDGSLVPNEKDEAMMARKAREDESKKIEEKEVKKNVKDKSTHLGKD